MAQLGEIIKNIGLSDKAALVYLAALELGQGTVQELAERAKLKRTTIYYTIEELLGFGALIQGEKGKKTLYVAEAPNVVLQRARERLLEFEESLPQLEQHRNTAIKKPNAYFLYGINGFKQIWDKVLLAKDKEYLIITEGENFLDYVKEKYIMRGIIQRKKRLGVHSRQLILDSPYGRKIIAKDLKENRESRLLPPLYKFPFTQIICQDFVAFTSPRVENLLIVIESPSYAKSQRSLFNTVWDALEKK